MFTTTQFSRCARNGSRCAPAAYTSVMPKTTLRMRFELNSDDWLGVLDDSCLASRRHSGVVLIRDREMLHANRVYIADGLKLPTATTPTTCVDASAFGKHQHSAEMVGLLTCHRMSVCTIMIRSCNVARACLRWQRTRVSCGRWEADIVCEPRFFRQPRQPPHRDPISPLSQPPTSTWHNETRGGPVAISPSVTSLSTARLSAAAVTCIDLRRLLVKFLPKRDQAPRWPADGG